MPPSPALAGLGLHRQWSGAAYPAPAIVVSPASQDFGYIQVGATAERTFYVTNSGGGTLSGSATAPTPFSIVSGGTYNLAANALQAVVIRYSPAVAGTDNATVTFTGGAGATPPVVGAAYPAPAISVSPASQDFGYIQVGATAERTFYVTNNGGGTLSGSASVPTPFSIVSGGTYSLAANASQAVVIRYSPATVGTNNATVTCTGGAGATPPVVGGGLPGACDCRVAGESGFRLHPGGRHG